MPTKIVIPALFVIEAPSEHQAEEMAGDMQAAANRLAMDRHWPESYLYMDEGMGNAVVHVSEDCENPHSILGIISGLTLRGK